MKQSLEFVAETRNLTEVEIENRGKDMFRGKKNRQAYLFSMKMKMMICECKLKVQNSYLL